MINKSAGTALVTGGSSGIGYECALLLARKGFDIVLVSNEKEKLEAICDNFTSQFSIKALPVFADLARPEAASELYEWCSEHSIQVDVLVNNAGIFFFGEVVKTPPDKVRTMLQLHMITPVLLCQMFGKDMKARRNGHILNMASFSAWMPYPGITTYSATKRFLVHFSRAFRSEMIEYGVNVTCVCPGAVATNLYEPGTVDIDKAIRWGVMMKADKLAATAVRALFRRESRVVPGLFNRISLFFLRITPHFMVLWFRRNSRVLPIDK